MDQHNRATVLFLTVCTKNRFPRLANDAAHATLRNAWLNARDWRVGRYVVLPDHVHFFCAPAIDPPPALAAWVSYWKRLVSQTLGYSKAQPLWQRDFWDTQLRRGDSYADKWEYVRHNPVRHGLVSQAEDWPYQGEIDALWWHD